MSDSRYTKLSVSLLCYYKVTAFGIIVPPHYRVTPRATCHECHAEDNNVVPNLAAS